MNDEYESVAAPTDRQIENNLIFTLGVSADVHLLEPTDWNVYADRRTDPIPSAFQTAIDEAILKLPVSSGAHLAVVVENRPPHADPLFARYFVDLTPIFIELSRELPSHVIGALISNLIDRVTARVENLVKSNNLEQIRIEDTFSVQTLKILSENFVHFHRPSGQITNTTLKPWNHYVQHGYIILVDHSLPYGWTITVLTEGEQFEFIVDYSANVHHLSITNDTGKIDVAHASLKSPEISDMTQVHSYSSSDPSKPKEKA